MEAKKKKVKSVQSAREGAAGGSRGRVPQTASTAQPGRDLLTVTTQARKPLSEKTPGRVWSRGLVGEPLQLSPVTSAVLKTSIHCGVSYTCWL